MRDHLSALGWLLGNLVVWRTRGKKIPKKSCRPLQGSGESLAAGEDLVADFGRREEIVVWGFFLGGEARGKGGQRVFRFSERERTREGEFSERGGWLQRKRHWRELGERLVFWEVVRERDSSSSDS